MVELNIPPLRERLEDLPLLTENILDKISRKLGAKQLSVAPEVFEVFAGCQWPGNVRELGNVLEMAAIVCTDGVIRVQHLPRRIFRDTPTVKSAACIQPLKEMEAEALKTALAQCGGNIAKVSRQLGLSRSTIYRRMKNYGIGKSISIG